MRLSMIMPALALSALALHGCNTAEDPRVEGVSFGAGDAIAHNSALQIIDPWPAGVQDTDLAVPARRGGSAAESGGDTGAQTGQTTTSLSD